VRQVAGREEDAFGVTRLEAIAELGQPLLGGRAGVPDNHTFIIHEATAYGAFPISVKVDPK